MDKVPGGLDKFVEHVDSGKLQVVKNLVGMYRLDSKDIGKVFKETFTNDVAMLDYLLELVTFEDAFDSVEDYLDTINDMFCNDDLKLGLQLGVRYLQAFPEKAAEDKGYLVRIFVEHDLDTFMKVYNLVGGIQISDGERDVWLGGNPRIVKWVLEQTGVGMDYFNDGDAVVYYVNYMEYYWDHSHPLEAPSFFSSKLESIIEAIDCMKSFLGEHEELEDPVGDTLDKCVDQYEEVQADSNYRMGLVWGYVKKDTMKSVDLLNIGNM